MANALQNEQAITLVCVCVMGSVRRIVCLEWFSVWYLSFYGVIQVSNTVICMAIPWKSQ